MSLFCFCFPGGPGTCHFDSTSATKIEGNQMYHGKYFIEHLLNCLLDSTKHH